MCRSRSSRIDHEPLAGVSLPERPKSSVSSTESRSDIFVVVKPLTIILPVAKTVHYHEHRIQYSFVKDPRGVLRPTSHISKFSFLEGRNPKNGHRKARELIHSGPLVLFLGAPLMCLDCASLCHSTRLDSRLVSSGNASLHESCVASTRPILGKHIITISPSYYCKRHSRLVSATSTK